ncbi:hypothetical protein ASF79_00835 [Agreia sp. Leaf335]|uniref:hypothetical protein n=1 Tax=Agreia sp. Leaf335 TaxID=1736340 RepID=UPI0006FBCAC7|nr:hypothetical protein [Agreia sp. Leaf335]KQR23840.1 hypothetical protein ASF79_00835 [Agreia sp. Leaf335]
MNVRVGAKEVLAWMRTIRASNAPKRMDELTDDERLRITRFTARVDSQEAGGTSWFLAVYGFGSSTPLAHQNIELPAELIDRRPALDSALGSLSLVRWGECMAVDLERIEGCCVHDFAERSVA